MKLSMVFWIICTIPGTLMETRVRIVKKERSLSRLQMYWMNMERKKLRATPPGIAAKTKPVITRMIVFPREVEDSSICIGMSAVAVVLSGKVTIAP